MNHSFRINYSLVALFLSYLFLMGCQKQDVPTATNRLPPEVDVAIPLKKIVTDWDDYIGRFKAIEEVQVRSRVTGYLDAIHFEDGAFVQEGDVLFNIDSRTFQYNLDKARAQFALAQKEFKRAENLTRTEALSKGVYDQRLENLKVAEASLRLAEIDLAYTEVKAPISGRISRDFLTTGNLVTADDTVLTRIVSVNPVHFYFEISQNLLLKYLRLKRGSTGVKNGATSNAKNNDDSMQKPIYIKLQDEENYHHLGTLDFLDNVVDISTGTLQARAEVANPNQIIYPGLFGQARLRASAEYEAILVPASAINSDQSRKYVYFVDDENNAQRAYIKLGPSHGDELVIIREGLAGDERVVVSGIQRIRMPQQPVTPTPVVIQDDQSDFSSRTLPSPKASQQLRMEPARIETENNAGS